MNPAISYQGILRVLEGAFRTRYKRDDVNITGILFARPPVTSHAIRFCPTSTTGIIAPIATRTSFAPAMSPITPGRAARLLRTLVTTDGVSATLL